MRNVYESEATVQIQRTIAIKSHVVPDFARFENIVQREERSDVCEPESLLEERGG